LAWGGYLVRGTIITQMLRAEATAASTAGPIKIVRKEAVLEWAGPPCAPAWPPGQPDTARTRLLRLSSSTRPWPHGATPQGANSTARAAEPPSPEKPPANPSR